MALAGPGATLAASAALMLAGGLAFASQAAVEPGADRVPGPWPIRLPGVLTLVPATLLADTAPGVADVTLIAFADLEGNPETGGVLIALFAAGTVVGGLAFGARTWPGSPSRQLAAITAAASLAMAPLALADSLLAAAPLAILAGAPGAAQLAAASLTLDGPAGAPPERRRTRGCLRRTRSGARRWGRSWRRGAHRWRSSPAVPRQPRRRRSWSHGGRRSTDPARAPPEDQRYFVGWRTFVSCELL